MPLGPVQQPATQLPPGVPQWASPVVKHWFPEQQPAAHDVASQMQAPPKQRCPGAHAWLPLQPQTPPLQVSVDPPTVQSLQLEPLLPQEVFDWVVHTPFLQHPLAQVAGVQPEQTPLAQVCGLGQV